MLATIKNILRVLLCSIMKVTTRSIFGTKLPEKKRVRRSKAPCCRYYRRSYKSRPAQIMTKRVRQNVRLAYTANTQYSEHTFKPDSDSFTIGLDNHASFSMSNDKRHFVGTIRQYRTSTVKGVGGSLPIKGIGTVKWKITDDNGRQHAFEISGTLYVPGLRNSMLSPQHWAAQMVKTTNQPAWEETRPSKSILYWNGGRSKRTVPLHPNTNTPIMESSIGATNYRVFETVFNKIHLPSSVICSSGLINDDIDEQIHEQNMMDIIKDDMLSKSELKFIRSNEDEDIKMDDPQAELLRWHHRLGHTSFKTIRLLAAANMLPRHLLQAKIPKCSSCQYGAMTKRPWRGRSQPSKIKPTMVRGPGDCVSVDQMESSLPGFMAQLKGRLTKKRYNYATIFVDHYSRLKYVHLQESISSEQTVEAKIAFEAYSRRHGVTISHYHADNGRFADRMFLDHAADNQQTMSYCGVNAHFQNGIAEKAIRDLQEQGRKQLLHAKARWPEVIHLSLWPYAMRNAAYVANLMPSQDGGISPLELFTRTEVAPNLKQMHTFGCPVYTLHNRLQAGGSVPRWHPRARLGVNLGPSPKHGRQVSLVLSPITGLVSPQYHVSHDDYFETTRKETGNPMTHSTWQQLSGMIVRRMDENAPQGISPIHATNLEDPSREAQEPPHEEIEDLSRHEDEAANTPEVPENQADYEINRQPESMMLDQSTSRYGRTRRLTQRLQDAMETRALSSTLALQEDLDTSELYQDPVAMLTTANSDTMYYHQAMKQHDAPQFVDAIINEINDHVQRKHWKLIPREDVPTSQKILPSVWSMKRKRDIKTQKVYKWKARLNIHGGKQVYGVNYTETFSPVVNWITVRLLLILSLIHGWKTRQVDFILAFPQADIECPMYMELPTSIEMRRGGTKTHVLQLMKNLYGQKQAGRVWNKHLHAKLSSLGFKRSNYDDCLYYKGKTLFAVYVDDGIFASPNAKDIDEAIKDLRRIQCDIEDQGELQDYLGVNVMRDSEGIHLTQPHLIDQIINDVGISPKSPPKSTPAASTVILTADPEGKSFEYTFDYRSVIGKLNFLEKSTRPDIAYAVHQCARFCANPKKSHGDAVIHLAKYLKSTREKGIILNPTEDKGLEVFADADFAGSWKRTEAEHDSATAKSRTGYLIQFAGCLITWKSKMQTIIALSSTEAEYVSLSQSMREAIPIMGLIDEMRDKGIIKPSPKTNVKCKAFEDNLGAIELARLPKMRPRTKHINISYHHFREFVADGSVKILPISTKEQVADLLTKPLPQNQFLKLRKLLLTY